MTDWVVWPIFLVQLLIFVLLWVRRDKKLFGFHPRLCILWLILLIAITIVVSLWHDSTEPLPLYF
jgi:hypothetical protein